MVEVSGSTQSCVRVLVFIYVFITACRCSALRISVGLSHNVSHPGDNVTLTCRVQGAQKEIAVVWEKLPVTIGGDIEREIIGRDDQLSEDYAKLAKYDVFVVELPRVVISILTINHVGVEESGLIGCSVNDGGDTFRDTILFQVFKQPSDIWCSCEQCSINSEITEGDILKVQCIVRGVQPLPRITAHLNHRTLAGQRTNWTSNVHCGDRPASREGPARDVRHCPVHFDYDVQFRLTGHPVSYADDRHELAIAVSLGQSAGWPATVKRLPVNVKYAPKFNCSNTVDVQFHSNSLSVVCQLRANPALFNLPVVWWRHLHHRQNRTLHADQAIDGYELRVKKVDRRESPSSGSVRGFGGSVSYSVELVVTETQRSLDDDPTTFHFHAQNEVGSTTQTIHLRQQIATTSRYQPSTVRTRSHLSGKSSLQLVNKASTLTSFLVYVCAISTTFCLLSYLF